MLNAGKVYKRIQNNNENVKHLEPLQVVRKNVHINVKFWYNW